MEENEMAYFPSKSGLAAKLKGGINAMGEEVTFDVKVLCVFDERCNFG
jgi:hypothetical protein